MQDIVEHRWKTYDYPRYVHDSTHPHRLHSTATCFGLTPPDVATARVLELGCASGDNLIYMAARLPNARFVGVDLNEAAIQAGKSLVADVGLTNVELHCQDILDVPLDGEPFDYVIVHGIYSWVPPDVRRHILDVARGRMQPNGIAYVSYNALPGWRIWGVFREIMFERFGHVADPLAQADLAQDFIRWMKAGQVDEDAWWSTIVDVEAERLHMGGLPSVAHDQLSPMNEPMWFRDFAKQASDAGLRFVAETMLADNWLMQRPPEVSELLDGVVDPIERETMSDYIVGRTFRRTLLCHTECNPARPRSHGRLIDRLYATTPLVAKDPVDLTDGVEVTFKDTASTRQIVSEASLLKAVLVAAKRLDQPTVPELCDAAGALRGEPLSPEERIFLEATVWGWAKMGIFELLTSRVPRARLVSRKPRAERLIQVCAATDLPVVNVLHELVATDDVDRTLLARCDGEHDVYDLARALDQRLDEGPLRGVKLDQPIPPEVPERLAVCAALVRGRLKRYADWGLLIA